MNFNKTNSLETPAQIRKEALILAIRATRSTDTAETVIETAKKFAVFLGGDPAKLRFPGEDHEIGEVHVSEE